MRLPSLDEQYPEESRTAAMLSRAMNAGLRGEKLPNFGSTVLPCQLLLVNSVYDEARNKHAAMLARTRDR